ncbi:MAG: heat-shock protein Hsp20 [Sulfuricurvum sp. PC08-66]|nr:MAG: heat-shock protein Hsp20 [Sulfuricurvum sp. PC08-66]
MYITRTNPFYFEPFIGASKESEIATFKPLVNTRETDKAFFIDVDVPGIKKEEISIDIKEGRLTISGERNFKEEVKEEDFYKVETRFGKFARTFSLPDKVDIEKIEAKYEHGVLEVVIPKLPDVDTTKKITVQ